MKTAIFGLVALAMALSTASEGAARPQSNRPQPNRIDIEYAAPKSPQHRKLFELTKERRLLEKVRDALAPLKLPRRLVFKLEGCDGESNAWYEDGAVTVCYEFLDDVWKNVPADTTAAGVTPVDALAGPIADVFLHETGHAVFELLDIPVFGREEDAADFFSAYIMLQFQKDEARRLILGTAYQYKSELLQVWTLKKYADEHSAPAQRFFNVLCLAYGADPELFKDVIDSGFLPKERAEFCSAEYGQIAFAFDRLIRPHIDRKLARRLHRTWLPPVTHRPPRRPSTGTAN